jgi:hypothetical protein
MIKTSEELHPYISVCANIRLPMKECGKTCRALEVRKCGRDIVACMLDFVNRIRYG